MTRMRTKVQMFDDYETEVFLKMNHFMKDKNVVDVKMNSLVALTGNFFTRYLVIYEEEQS